MSREVPDYQGFEQGPIRPPSEAGSLLIRVTRNCPWNKCTFCPVYKGARFSIRPVDHVQRDIDAVHRCVQDMVGQPGEGATGTHARRRANRVIPGDLPAGHTASHWVRHGMRHVFLQDADSLVIKPAHLLAILRHLQDRFPEAARVTSYARSRTLVRLEVASLAAFREAGLNRIHIGLESGDDQVLSMVRKGATQARHLEAGLKVKAAGMELSEYYMPGLGGQDRWREHARETAAALNRIHPDFIRLRTLAIPHHTPLHDDYQAGRFRKCTDVMMARELLLFLESLTGITSVIKSDHILNLLPEVEGVLPQDRERMMGVVQAFLELDPERQCLYQVGRRTGVMSSLSDLKSPLRIDRVEAVCRRHHITPDNVDHLTDDLMRRFI